RRRAALGRVRHDDGARLGNRATQSALLTSYSAWRRHHTYGWVSGYPAGESSHSSWRPSGVRSRKVQTLPRASTPRAVVKYVRKTLSPSRRKTLRPNVSPSWVDVRLRR